MNLSTRSISLLFLLSLLPQAAESSEYQQFTPHPVDGELSMPERGKGILVQRITIKRGDTLSQISRSFSGKSSYFPQILLFNNIANPNLIFAGKELLVPISRQDALSKTAPSGDQNAVSKRTEVPAVKTAVPPARKQRTDALKPLAENRSLNYKQPANNGEQDSYSQAVTAFGSREYDKALSLFDRFLERYPSSSMAADASLYKAECLLKLSAQ